MKFVRIFIGLFFLSGLFWYGEKFYRQSFLEKEILKQMIINLQADSRVAEVLVTDVFFDESKNKQMTTIKFLEYDVQGNSLQPQYYTFDNNLIQFQSLVIRFDDDFIRGEKEELKKSAHVFWKVFVLDRENTQEFYITKPYEIPEGYKLMGDYGGIEKQIWSKFWTLALNKKQADAMGIKNVQVEAPGVRFVPGYLYSLKIEHDGGLRIDAKILSPILKGEKMW